VKVLLTVLFAFCSQAIKKVMKMDAAEPFNTPVDPVALGIPVSIFCTQDVFCFTQNYPSLSTNVMDGMAISSI
jgi:hypothetical protein